MTRLPDPEWHQLEDDTDPLPPPPWLPTVGGLALCFWAVVVVGWLVGAE